MSLSEPFIRRPVATMLLTVGILLLGALSYTRLPIAALPSVDRPTIGVWAGLPGASPETIATSLAQPLERQLGIIPGIAEMESFSGPGGVQVTIQFDLSKDVDAAAIAVLAAINAATPNLPKDMPRPPVYWKSNPSGFPVIALALTSDLIDPGAVYDYADSVIAQKLGQIDGVARVDVVGGERTAVRVQVDPRLIAGMGLSLEQIRLAIAAASQNLPKGSFVDGAQSFVIGANDQIFKAADYRELVVAWSNGAPVKLGDIAQVSDSVINRLVAGWYNHERAVIIRVFKQPDANVVATVDQVKAMLAQLDRWVPPAIKLHVVYDRTLLIRASIADVQLTIAVAIALVILVIALFLRRFWATVIPSLTIPVSLAATLAAMVLLGYSLDNLSLMALTISIGFVVDDAVIMIENISRRIEAGEGGFQAALAGGRQMGFTVVSITAALVSALIPILFMPDVVGRYFREFGLTLVIAITASALVSLTLTPMLCSRLLNRTPEPPDAVSAPGRLGRASAALLHFYVESLEWSLHRRWLALSLTAAAAAASVWLYMVLPKGYMPTQDTGILGVRTITTANVSFATMEQRQRAAVAAILEDPAVGGLVSFVYEGYGHALSGGDMVVNLKPPAERRLHIQQVVERLRERLARVDGLRTFFTPWQDLLLGIGGSASRYQYTLLGIDGEAVSRAAEAMRRRMVAMPQLADVVSNAESSGLEAGVGIDREAAARMGVSPAAIDATLYNAFGQREIGWLYLPLNYSTVVIEIDPRLATDPSSFDYIYVPGAGGGQVPLTAVTERWRAHGAMWMRHQDQFPAITISFDTKPGVSLGQAIAAIRAGEAAVHLPDEVKTRFRGEADAATKSGLQQVLLFLGALFAVYVVLGVLYESYAHPFTILSTLPSTAFGALLALALTRTQFTIPTSIACILLVGIVMKNAIMMVDFALEAERKHGMAPAQAIRAAARLRVRPIVMTTLTAILSAVPLAVGTGPGYEIRQPLGIAIVGGLTVSQLLTLYTTPVIYLMIDRLRTRRSPLEWAVARS